MARFLVDESLPPQLAQTLVAMGQSAVHCRELSLGGAEDDAIYAAAQGEQAVLLTLGLDFSDMRRFVGHRGIVVIRVRHRVTRDELISLSVALVSRFAAEIKALQGQIMILQPHRSRIRRRF